MKLLIVIVNYRTPQLVVDCLRTIEPQRGDVVPMQVMVTDNASGDDSIDVISNAIQQNGWQDWVAFMPLENNGGFAYGNNEAIRPALKNADKPDYILLLNPDTTLRDNALKPLIHFMDDHPKVGIAGSRIENPDESVRRTAFRYHSVLGEFLSSSKLGILHRLCTKWVVAPPVRVEDHQVDWVSGASMLVRREVIDEIGLLDDGYFMYYEEMDFCRRATRAGWQCWYIADSRVVHLVGQASGVTGEKRMAKRRPKYWFESRKRYLTKMHGRVYKFMADVAWLAGFACWRTRVKLLGKPDEDPPHLMRDFVTFNFLGQYRSE